MTSKKGSFCSSISPNSLYVAEVKQVATIHEQILAFAGRGLQKVTSVGNFARPTFLGYDEYDCFAAEMQKGGRGSCHQETTMEKVGSAKVSPRARRN